VAKFLNWSTMKANPTKCAALAVTTDRNGNPTADADFVLKLDDEVLPTLDLHSSYSYLGIGDGFNHVKRRFVMGPKLLQMKKQTAVLLRSGLAPWQILRAIKTYIHSQATYLLRHTRPVQEQLQSYDKFLASGLRHLLRLPKTATTHAIFAPIANGGLGFVPLADLHAVLQISHVWQMLHSQDPTIRDVARTQAIAVIDKRYQLHREHWKDRDDELIQLFLNSELQNSPFAPIKRHHGDIGSLWVDVQRQLRIRQLRFSRQEIDNEHHWLQLVVPHDDRPLHTKNITSQLTRTAQTKYTDAWKQLKDQGKLYAPTAAPVATSSRMASKCGTKTTNSRSERG
jgi:hypothetical protein